MAESGSELRERLEAVLAENKALRGTTTKVVASAYKYVKPEDLDGVDPDQLMDKAKELEAARIEERRRIFEETAKELGLEISADQTSKPAGKDETASRIASVGSLTGTPLKPPDPGEGLTGPARIEAVLAARNEARKRRTLA